MKGEALLTQVLQVEGPLLSDFGMSTAEAGEGRSLPLGTSFIFAPSAMDSFTLTKCSRTVNELFY